MYSVGVNNAAESIELTSVGADFNVPLVLAILLSADKNLTVPTADESGDDTPNTPNIEGENSLASIVKASLKLTPLGPVHLVIPCFSDSKTFVFV